MKGTTVWQKKGCREVRLAPYSVAMHGLLAVPYSRVQGMSPLPLHLISLSLFISQTSKALDFHDPPIYECLYVSHMGLWRENR